MTRNQTNYNVSLLVGAVAGSAIVTGLVLYFRPRLRKRMMKSLGRLRDTAAVEAQEIVNSAADVLDRVADASDAVAARADEVRDDVAAAVEHAAHVVSQSANEVEQFAKASKTVQ